MASARITVRLIPRARADAITGERDGAIVVRVTAPPEGGRANAALCRVIAARAGVGVRSVSIVQGASARLKVVQVEGVTGAQLARALRPG